MSTRLHRLAPVGVPDAADRAEGEVPTQTQVHNPTVRTEPTRRPLLLGWWALAAILTGCLNVNDLPKAKLYQSKLDPLAIQQMQTQEFETSKKTLFAATISVFQDTGYTIEAGDLETGLVTAKSPTSLAAVGQFGLVRTSSGETVEGRATAFIEVFRVGHATARINFIERRCSAWGQTNDTPNEDPAYYEMVFNKIREAVFLREALQPKSPTK